MKTFFSVPLVAAVAVVVFVVLLPAAEAYETGAGGCAGGYAAVGGSHWLGNITTGPLSFGGLVATLDGQPLSMFEPSNFTIGQDHMLTLQGTTITFKGILMRLGSTGGVGTTKALSVLSGDNTLRLAYDTCIPLGAGGVTHTSDDNKPSSTAILRLDSVASNLPLDITAVIKNDDGISTFYYSGFLLNAVAGKGVLSSTTTKVPPLPTRPPPTRPPPTRPSRLPNSRPVTRPRRRPSRRSPTRPN